ncbi:MAG: translation elongation factor 4 [Chloroflexi bacterium]|nr:translation elongation factor 4 [Chloroflexota bacterium]
MTAPQHLIRNFCIIAHVDHGKSTLADRLLEWTHTISEREMENQVLDTMDLERERGITIKAQAVRLFYEALDGQTYELNLIDTPGHVDFGYEVSRSLAACEGALLVVDASQGVEAQTLANLYLAIAHDLAVIPVINKIDLPTADPERVLLELRDGVGLDCDCAVLTSAKAGIGTREVLEAIVKVVPPPQGDGRAPLKALIFDSHYDPFKGVVAYVRMMEGEIQRGERYRLMQSGVTMDVLEIGVFRPGLTPVESLSAGEVGYLATGLKAVRDCRVGDTVTGVHHPAAEPLPGYEPAKPMVFAGLYPTQGDDYPLLRDALEKLSLNDSSLVYEPENSVALGFGFRCGFLGLLHMEIIQERLEREYHLDLLATAPSVRYQVTLPSGEVMEIDSPAKLPPAQQIAEPWVQASILTPTRYIGALMELATTRRGAFKDMSYLDPDRVLLRFDLPLSEIITEFYDSLKSRSQGYASLDYTMNGFMPSRLVKLDILVNGQPVDALSVIVHQDKAYQQGKVLVEKLKELIPRQLFEVPIQAAIGGKIIARETIRALRKDVLAKCYGGDITRKRKLLEKQAEGKKRMKRIGNVEIPQEAFMAVLKLQAG